MIIINLVSTHNGCITFEKEVHFFYLAASFDNDMTSLVHGAVKCTYDLAHEALFGFLVVNFIMEKVHHAFHFVLHAWFKYLLLQSRRHLLEESVLVMEDIPDRVEGCLSHLGKTLLIHFWGNFILWQDSIHFSHVFLNIMSVCLSSWKMGFFYFEVHHTTLY